MSDINHENLVKNLCGNCKQPCKDGYCSVFTRALDAINQRPIQNKNNGK